MALIYFLQILLHSKGGCKAQLVAQFERSAANFLSWVRFHGVTGCHGSLGGPRSRLYGDGEGGLGAACFRMGFITP